MLLKHSEILAGTDKIKNIPTWKDTQILTFGIGVIAFSETLLFYFSTFLFICFQEEVAFVVMKREVRWRSYNVDLKIHVVRMFFCSVDLSFSSPFLKFMFCYEKLVFQRFEKKISKRPVIFVIFDHFFGTKFPIFCRKVVEKTLPKLVPNCKKAFLFSFLLSKDVYRFRVL